jgi:hypothetical protein
MKSSSKEFVAISAFCVGTTLLGETCFSKTPEETQLPVVGQQLIQQEFDHCRDLVDAVVNETAMIEQTAGLLNRGDLIKCQQFENHQNRRAKARNVCESLQKNLPQYCTGKPDSLEDIHTSVRQLLGKIDNLPFDVDVDCSVDKPVQYEQCECPPY